MKSLPRPAHEARPVFDLCVSRVADRCLKARLDAASERVGAAAARFDRAATDGTLHRLMPDEAVLGVTGVEMEKVYTQRMARRTAPGRRIYDELLAAAPSGICPLCQQRVASTLDHHLPKARFPALTVAPMNLVPACSDCNKAKLDALPRSAEEVALHPYYDDIDDETWLAADVVEGAPSAVVYRVMEPADWSRVLACRVRHHFKSLRLGQLYAAQAAEELLNLKYQLGLIHSVAGHRGVRDELRLRHKSCLEARRNGWRTAAYHAWAKSDWFCGGGFAEGL